MVYKLENRIKVLKLKPQTAALECGFSGLSLTDRELQLLLFMNENILKNLVHTKHFVVYKIAMKLNEIFH